MMCGPEWKGFHSATYFQCACIAAVNVVLGVFFVCLTTKHSRNRIQRAIERDTITTKKESYQRLYKKNIRSKYVDKQQ